MVSLQTPVCEFGRAAPDFNLPGVDGRHWSREQCMGEKGLLVMFICNHCPYVKAVIGRAVADCRVLMNEGVGVAAIMPNDTVRYPDDGLEMMKRFAADHAFPFPYLIDETQAVAKAYDAVCTPDFMGYNGDLELCYRGRLDAGRLEAPPPGAKRELLDAMREIAATGSGPAEQVSSMGCSVKWREAG